MKQLILVLFCTFITNIIHAEPADFGSLHFGKLISMEKEKIILGGKSKSRTFIITKKTKYLNNDGKPVPRSKIKPKVGEMMQVYTYDKEEKIADKIQVGTLLMVL